MDGESSCSTQNKQEFFQTSAEWAQWPRLLPETAASILQNFLSDYSKKTVPPISQKMKKAFGTNFANLEVKGRKIPLRTSKACSSAEHPPVPPASVSPDVAPKQPSVRVNAILFPDQPTTFSVPAGLSLYKQRLSCRCGNPSAAPTRKDGAAMLLVVCGNVIFATFKHTLGIGSRGTKIRIAVSQSTLVVRTAQL